MSAQPASIDGLRIERRGAAAIVTFDRPARLNAIDEAMRTGLAAALPGLARDPNIYAVVIQASPARAFCAGGDIRELRAQVMSDPAAAQRNIGREYELVWQLECLPKPAVSLIDGAVMGSGVGMTLYGTHRVAGPAYRLSMPETAIGFFPDVGTAHPLSRMPHEIGLYLGLTGRAVARADALWLGLATHAIDVADHPAIIGALAEAEPVDPVLDGRHRDPGPPELLPFAEAIARCFSAPTLAEIDERLAAERSRADWAAGVRAELARKSPLALAVTLRHIRDARALDLRQVLAIDYRIACRLLVAPDFEGGVRALAIDKTGAPRWQHSRFDEVTEAMVERVLAPMPGAELVLPTHTEMSAQRD